jgi:hypothetical protein
MWKQCLNDATGTGCGTAGMTWPAALQHVEALNNGGGYAGYTDWRMPNAKEMASIIERSCTFPPFNTRVFNGVPSNRQLIWTSTPNHFDLNDYPIGTIWAVDTWDGNDYRELQSSSNLVWMVRDQ